MECRHATKLALRDYTSLAKLSLQPCSHHASHAIQTRLTCKASALEDALGKENKQQSKSCGEILPLNVFIKNKLFQRANVLLTLQVRCVLRYISMILEEFCYHFGSLLFCHLHDKVSCMNKLRLSGVSVALSNLQSVWLRVLDVATQLREFSV